ncbi:double-strand break repair helicase AddA [Polymorphobacter sp. PAMC 29334]|uniref:double-strand break repair helicase AddA n=1 Tax=Polymorphobacter sp. PAMC 29334 TaxID=2862331 RepID=UPI001C76D42A|nr:double-strand break repair helicase AddA [Polymorphobacter sp. PAMC 29334]QYE34950.1 double-strand break repair helicase AddA [Polymorphobacter sp. PAMC 29334]
MRGLQHLLPVQADGASPAGSAWMSASAGTGKTQVLTARVLRLLLGGSPPERILALTFTKAGAAEMQTRIFDRLSSWVAAGDNELKSDLAAIRADTDPETCARARQLFARVLDAKGGLQVQTIHGFAQSLLASFPLEAGIAPGFAALDDRSALALRGQVLAESIEQADDDEFLADVAAMAIASGEARLATIAATLIAHHDAIAALGNPQGFEPKLRRAFGLPGEGSPAEVLANGFSKTLRIGLLRLAHVYQEHGGQTSLESADTMLWWLDTSVSAQVEHFDRLRSVFHKADGERRKVLVPGGKKADPRDIELANYLCAQITVLAETQRLLSAVANAARHLRVGARLGGAYALHKHRAGVIDYDDMIARAAALLKGDGASAWVRYKLDRRIDHLLVDEAQDTNEAQWDIVEALTDEFFDGEGARDVQRTLFVVGDFKQAIFSFQGSDPKIFEGRQGHFKAKAEDAGLGWSDLPMTLSFRSTPAVLEVVNAVIDDLGPEALGMNEGVLPHAAHRADAIGSVTLWPPLVPEADEEVVDDDAPWLPAAQVLMAHKLARQIAAWLNPATALDLPARGRACRPEDILVLVRSRGEFVGALVAALHDFGVPVAGVDRLRLTAPLAVQDLLAVIRFALQPDDDLTCAALLTSPFVGMSQDDLFTLAHPRRGTLWSAVRDAGGAASEFLSAALGLADFAPPYEFLETILSGPLQGRRRLLGRLGAEARDQIAALLGQALAFETANAPSLQGFLSWIEADDIDLKRDPDAPVDAVRIMTVHGAKGLQAPVVVLADATKELPRDRDGHVMLALDGSEPVPVFHGGKAGKVGIIAAEADARAAASTAEHWRLLYVALTRAEDLLFIGGALAKPRGDKPSEVPPDSWYAAVDRAMTANMPLAEDADPIWGSARVHRAGTTVTPEPRAVHVPAKIVLPDWATSPAAPEARPPRPLSPSAIAADDVAQPPPGPAAKAAARRGQLLHTLFERLPGVAAEARTGVAAAWLARAAPDLPAAKRDGIAACALDIIAAPRFAALFGPDALAEAPIAATVGDIVIAGTVDRLLVGPDSVQVIDFKTGARVPGDAASVVPYHLRQMAAYAAALARIFPDKALEAALLYTHDATLIELPAALLAAHAPG